MCSCACSLSGSLMLKPLISNFCAPTYYPILFIFSRFALSMIFIFFPSIAIIFSWAKAERVRMAFEVVIFDKLAKSSRAK